jgi:hypothetical protein
MKKFKLNDLEVHVAPSGVSDDGYSVGIITAVVIIIW